MPQLQICSANCKGIAKGKLDYNSCICGIRLRILHIVKSHSVYSGWDFFICVGLLTAINWIERKYVSDISNEFF